MLGLFELSAAMQWLAHAFSVERAMHHQVGEDCGVTTEWCACCTLVEARRLVAGEEFYT